MDRLTSLQQHLLPSPCSSAEPAILLRDRDDLLLLDGLLTENQREIRAKVRAFASSHLTEEKICSKYETATFPHEVIAPLGALKVAGTGLFGYGCAGYDVVTAGLVALELGRKDAGIATFMSILQPISMVAILKCGSEEQKQKYLPRMAAMELIGCFGLTEPESGSDAANLDTTATPTKGGWILNGQKRWIGNGTFADIYIIWAKNTETNAVNGFIVEKGTRGLSTKKMENKMALRCVQNADIFLEDCFVSDAARLPGAVSFATGPGNCLFLTRLSTAWIASGIALGAMESALHYSLKRKQFGAPLAQLQITQQKLAKMLSLCQSMSMLTWRASTLCDKNELSLGQVGLCKAHATAQARIVVSLAREIVGGNGIITDFAVGKHFADIEALYTFEGSYDVNILIAMKELTGLNAIRPAIRNK